MKVKRVLVDLYRLFVSREAGEKEKEGSRGTMGRGREKIPLPIVSRALSMDTQREPLRWKESYYKAPRRRFLFWNFPITCMNPLKFWYVLQQQP